LVEYEVGGVVLSHEAYIWSVTGQRSATSYPGSSHDPLDGFRHLAAELYQYAQDFLSGSDEAFVKSRGGTQEQPAAPPGLTCVRHRRPEVI
jgi:hypothetical protein